MKSDEPSFAYEAIECVSRKFSVPFEKANIDCSLLKEEWDDIVDYSKCYLNIAQEDYKTIWWKPYNSVDAQKWSNLLGLA